MEPEPTDARTRRSFVGTKVALLLLLVASVGCVAPAADAGPSPIAVGGHPLFGKPAPEIDLETFDGERMTLSSLRGRPVLVNFWATWCIPCRDEFPLMVQTYAERADEGLEILGILHDDTVEGGRAFAADQGAAWPMLYDAADEAWDDYLGLGMPTSFFIDAEGVVRAFSLGPFSEEGLPRQLATIMPEGDQAAGTVVPEGDHAAGTVEPEGDQAADATFERLPEE